MFYVDILAIDGKADNTSEVSGFEDIRQPYLGTPGCGDLTFINLGEAGVTGLEVDILRCVDISQL